MGDAAGEAADRLEFLRLQQRLARLVQSPLVLLALGDVTRDLGEADQPAVIVTDRVDDDIRPEAAAVLANPQPFVLEPALAGGDRQAALRQADGAILVGVELGEVLTDNFIGGVALEALAAEVPVGDQSVGIEHVDRVVGDPLHQQPEPLFAQPQRVLRPPLLGQVADHLGEADDRPGRVADRVDDDMRPELAAVLADPPALRLEATFAGGGSQRLRRHVLGARLARIEDREVLADRFMRFIAVEAPRAGVPARHFAVPVEHVDRIVEYGLDENAITLVFGKAPARSKGLARSGFLSRRWPASGNNPAGLPTFPSEWLTLERIMKIPTGWGRLVPGRQRWRGGGRPDAEARGEAILRRATIS